MSNPSRERKQVDTNRSNCMLSDKASLFEETRVEDALQVLVEGKERAHKEALEVLD